jgi:stage II sporulation protein M
MRKRKKNFFRKNYEQSLDYIKKSRNFIYVILILFFLFFLIGYFIPVPESLTNLILEFIEELLRKTEGMSQRELMSFIFFNNLQSSFFGMIFGVVLGIFSVVTTIVNGFLLGFVSSKTAQSEGILILWRLFPHGIFELPALIISMGMGLKLGTFIFQKKKTESFKRYLLDSLRVFLFIVLPLLFVAAIIEVILIFLFKG